MSGQQNFNDDQHFTISNIPFGIVSLKSKPGIKQIATRLYGDVYVLPSLIENGLLGDVSEDVIAALNEPTLNKFASYPRSVCRQIRTLLQRLLATDASPNPLLAQCKHTKTDVLIHLPIKISDFTDFSCSMNHVQNAAEAMTGNRSMPPCFLHFPPGYSGRCSSIVLSGTPIRRPLGQFLNEHGKVMYGPTRKLDFELEMAAVIGMPTQFGQPVSAAQAEQHIFGMVLLNDWSARDIQALEMMPLGPLNGKSLGTTISPWVVTLDALESFVCSPPARDPDVPIAPYLQQTVPSGHYSIRTQVDILHHQTTTTVCQSNFQDLYWPITSLVAHQTSNGCSLNTGDLLGTGTISGSTPGSFGCLLESTMGGRRQIELSNGEKRAYLQDGDGVRLIAWAGEMGTESCVGFGESFGVVEAALSV